MAALDAQLGSGPDGRAGEWDDEADVVIVGLGAAGASAALQAAEDGASVLVLDRFDGGGATRRSGGVVYVGGGTRQQKAAGFSDDAEQMYRYLRAEVGDSVTQSSLRDFCDESLANLAWLEAHGVPFQDAFFPGKTTVPPDDTCLYYSGNEKQRRDVAVPAPRGHRTEGPGLTGKVLFRKLRAAVGAAGVRVRERTRVTRLVTDENGAVVGVEATTLAGRPAAAAVQTALFWAVYFLAPLRVPFLPALQRLLDTAESRLGRPVRVRARNGVVLASGGFSFNRDLVRRVAPAYEKCLPIGTPGDVGAAMGLAADVGAATGELECCAASRFLAPPEAFLRGLLVGPSGERLCDESSYGATLGRSIADAGGRAWLVIDAAMWRDCRQELRDDERLTRQPLVPLLTGAMNHKVFRKMNGFANLYVNRRQAPTLRGLAGRCGMDADRLEATVDRYNTDLAAGSDTIFGKLGEWCAPVAEAPFFAIDCRLGNPLFLSPFITLGGLRVDGGGQVLRQDGSLVDGLYAAGRAAVGVSSRSYVSGLSLADCVYSGRNVGRHATKAGRASTGPRPAS